jgi:hypothetical protein
MTKTKADSWVKIAGKTWTPTLYSVDVDRPMLPPKEIKDILSHPYFSWDAECTIPDELDMRSIANEIVSIYFVFPKAHEVKVFTGNAWVDWMEQGDQSTTLGLRGNGALVKEVFVVERGDGETVSNN